MLLFKIKDKGEGMISAAQAAQLCCLPMTQFCLCLQEDGGGENHRPRLEDRAGVEEGSRHLGLAGRAGGGRHDRTGTQTFFETAS